MIIYNNIYKNLKLYKQGYQPNYSNIIKLNSNENSYNPSIKLIKNLLKEIKFFGNILKYYPDTNSVNIKLIISKFYNIKLEELFIGNGSDEVLAHTFLLFYKNKKILYIQNITYVFYESYIKLYKIKYSILTLKEDFSINYKKYKNLDGNILITNPNAPTGKLLNFKILNSIILNNKKSLILFDEAYIDFNLHKKTINLIKNYQNLLICRTLSKSRSLAGLRVGFIIGNENLIKSLNKIKNSFNTYPINILNQKLINYLYFHNIQFIKNIYKINKNRKFIKKNLESLNFHVIQSSANFLLIKHKNININNLTKYLQNYNIFIRKFEIPKIENYARISIGNKYECKKLIKYIKLFIKF